jgi:hypothetical protein
MNLNYMAKRLIYTSLLKATPPLYIGKYIDLYIRF